MTAPRSWTRDGAPVDASFPPAPESVEAVSEWVTEQLTGCGLLLTTTVAAVAAHLMGVAVIDGGDGKINTRLVHLRIAVWVQVSYDIDPPMTNPKRPLIDGEPAQRWGFWDFDGARIDVWCEIPVPPHDIPAHLADPRETS